MKKNKINSQKDLFTNNWLGEKEYLDFLTFQSLYGFAIRGGSISLSSTQHIERLCSSVNLLKTAELKQLIFSETLLNN